MQKMICLAATFMMLAVCSGGEKKYTVTGTVEGGSDGETVYLLAVADRQLAKQDSAVIENGVFVFRGEQEEAVKRYLAYRMEDQDNALMMDFYLENGNIQVQLTRSNDSATGTPNNDAYQEVRGAVNVLKNEMMALNEQRKNPALTDEQRQDIAKKMAGLEEKSDEVYKDALQKNIGNRVGIDLLKENFYGMDLEFLEALMPQIPAEYDSDKGIVYIKEHVKKMKATAVGEKFTDFAMQTPDGKPVKLSDYAGKGKVVLIDFWASWCGPCRREMPNLVKAYAQYKDKNFEIVGVSLDRDGEAWKNAIAKLEITWPQMSDLKFWNCEAAQLYAVSSIPHTVLLDADGTIIARGLHGEGLLKKLAETLGE